MGNVPSSRLWPHTWFNEFYELVFHRPSPYFTKGGGLAATWKVEVCVKEFGNDRSPLKLLWTARVLFEMCRRAQDTISQYYFLWTYSVHNDNSLLSRHSHRHACPVKFQMSRCTPYSVIPTFLVHLLKEIQFSNIIHITWSTPFSQCHCCHQCVESSLSGCLPMLFTVTKWRPSKRVWILWSYRTSQS